MMDTYKNFTDAHNYIARRFINGMGRTLPPGQWQGFDMSSKPEATMIELLFESFRVPLTHETLDHYRKDIPANYPWADDHFMERISGVPMNPGTEWANWPWGNSATKSLDENGMFNHNYMERYWPGHAGAVNEPTKDAAEWCELYMAGDQPSIRQGIRAPYGNVADIPEQLLRDSHTRQAYYPVYFPEDVSVQGRKPCTLGYHFIQRQGYLHIVYYMRSCDFFRHWADDCYLTIRLLLWVLEKCRQCDPTGYWQTVQPGFFHMHTTSLHLFINDVPPLKKKVGDA